MYYTVDTVYRILHTAYFMLGNVYHFKLPKSVSNRTYPASGGHFISKQNEFCLKRFSNNEQMWKPSRVKIKRRLAKGTRIVINLINEYVS